MIPVYQTLTVANDGRGNCFNACVASILELPLREVCSAMPGDDDYLAAWDWWFTGRELVCRRAEQAPVGYSIGTLATERTFPAGHPRAGQAVRHAVVVFNGRPVHDPFPGGDAAGDPLYFWTIERLERAAA